MKLAVYVENLTPSLEKLNTKKDQIISDAMKHYWPTEFSPVKMAIFRMGVATALFILLFDFKNSGSLTFVLFSLGIVTAGSSCLDPIADRMLILPVAIYTLAISNTLLLTAIVLMELCNTFIIISTDNLEARNHINVFGKIKMSLQAVGFTGILLFWFFPPLATLFTAVIWISLLFFMLSMRERINTLSTHHAPKIADQNLQYSFEEKRTI